MRLVSAIALIASLAPLCAGASEAPRQPGGIGTSSLTLPTPEWHRPISVGPEDARLVGEAASREIPIYLTPGEAARPATIRLAYLNAISDMPETFRLTLKINDRIIGETTVERADQPEVLSLPVPIGALSAGFNAIRVSVRQTHRVDCSSKATYELWTQLVPEQSELVFTGASGEIRDLRDLAAVNPDKTGTVRIRVSMPDGSSPVWVARASRAMQAAVLFGHYANPRVELTQEPTSEPGLDVIVGTAPSVESFLGTKVPGGPRTHISYDSQSGKVVLAVSGDTEAQVEEALDALAEQARATPLQGSTAGLRALKNMDGWQVEGGERLTLAGLGLESQPFRGRLERQTIRIQMPPDLLVADYGSVTLAVDAAYTSGLLPDSKLTIRVNGAPVSDARLSNPAGDVLKKRLFQIPISTFKPGLNTVDFEAGTRTGGDDVCDLKALSDQHERFLLSATSELTIPSLARVGALPNISSIIPGGLARLSGGDELGVFVPKARPEGLASALTTLAKTAEVSGRMTRATFSFDQVRSDVAHVLAFGSYDDMPDELLHAAGLDSVTLDRAWRGPAPAAAKITAAQQLVQVASAGNAINFAIGGLQADQDPGTAAVSGAATVQTGSPDDKGSGLEHALAQKHESWFQDYAGPVWGTASRIVVHSLSRMGLDPSREASGLPVSEASALVVAQGAQVAEDRAGWHVAALPHVRSTTVFVAPSPDALSRSVSQILAGSLWQQFVGNAAVFTPKDNAVTTRVSQDVLLVPTAALNVENIRLIAAGWLSRNVPVYLSILLGVLVAMTFLLHRVLRSSGVREP